MATTTTTTIHVTVNDDDLNLTLGLLRAMLNLNGINARLIYTLEPTPDPTASRNPDEPTPPPQQPADQPTTTTTTDDDQPSLRPTPNP